MRTFKVVAYVRIDDDGYDDPEQGFETYTPLPGDARSYVEEALETWGGSRHPGDPFFNVKAQVKSCVQLKNNPKMPQESR